MKENLPTPKASPPRIIWAALAVGAGICVIAVIGLSLYTFIWSARVAPKATTQGSFANGAYTAPDGSFICKFPWQNVDGETLTDDFGDGAGWVKYRNDFGVNVAVQYGPKQDELSWSQDSARQDELLDSFANMTISGLGPQARNVVPLYAQHRDSPRPELFTVIKYNMDQNASSAVIRGDLLLFENTRDYIITYAVYEWSPMYRTTQGDEWISALDREAHRFYSNCEFK